MPVIFAIIEYGCLSEFENLYEFQTKFLGYVKENSRLEVTLVVLVLSNFIALVLLHARIEYDAMQAQDEQTGYLVKIIIWLRSLKDEGLSNIVSSDFGYNLKTLRTALIFGIVMLMALVLLIAGRAESKKWSKLVFVVNLTVVLPIVFIYKHHGMKTVATKMIGSLIPDSLININI